MSEINGFKLSMAEFKGTVVESLKNIDKNIQEINGRCFSTTCEFRKRIEKLEKRQSFSISPSSWILNLLGFKK